MHNSSGVRRSAFAGRRVCLLPKTDVLAKHQLKCQRSPACCEGPVRQLLKHGCSMGGWSGRGQADSVPFQLGGPGRPPAMPLLRGPESLATVRLRSSEAQGHSTGIPLHARNRGGFLTREPGLVINVPGAARTHRLHGRHTVLTTRWPGGRRAEKESAGQRHRLVVPAESAK